MSLEFIFIFLFYRLNWIFAAKLWFLKPFSSVDTLIPPVQSYFWSTKNMISTLINSTSCTNSNKLFLCDNISCFDCCILGFSLNSVFIYYLFLLFPINCLTFDRFFSYKSALWDSLDLIIFQLFYPSFTCLPLWIWKNVYKLDN